LYRAGTNNSLKYLRSQNTEQERLKKWCNIEQEMSEDDFSSVVREEVLRKLLLLIEQLPEERRKIILMSMENMSGEEIANKLGVTIHTVKQQKYRAYKFIKEQLGEHWIIALYFFL
ncbi:MAG: RNA polymerase sigma factor, partial [Odoribacter sp.]|nr:RNA polymerase sigma factor [Odoribacter sp.]